MDMGIVCITMLVSNVGLVAISHLLHIILRQFRQLFIGQLVLRCRAECNVQDGLLRVPVCQQVILKGEQGKAHVLARSSRAV